MGAALIDEYQPPRIECFGYHHPPGGPYELVAFLGRASPFFLVEPGGVHPLYGPAQGGAAHLHGGHRAQILAPSLEGDERALLYVLLEQLAGSLVYLGLVEPGLFLGASGGPSWASLA